MSLRHTKIVCTLGPASDSLEVIKQLIEAGMDVARLNFSHGEYSEHKARIDRVREAADAVGKEVGLLVDIQGPKIRVGQLTEARVELVEGATILVNGREKFEGTKERICIGYPKLAEDLGPGNKLLIDDGNLQLSVVEKIGSDLKCRVDIGGWLLPRKGVSLPDVSVDLPALTEKDASDIKFAIENDIDFIAASFVRKAKNVHSVRRICSEHSHGRIPKIIAKIESAEGLKNIDEILEAADGMMVARGDLGVETPTEEVPISQKMIISKCNQAGKPVITATQMLESMIHNSRPTRAEATDVANAIIDGTDAVMLSGETSVGKYPVVCVRTMAAIAKRTEQTLNYERLLARRRSDSGGTVSDAIAHATCQTAMDLKARAIVVSTQTGSTAKMVSKYRPEAHILANTPHESVARMLTLNWGVIPIVTDHTRTTDEMLSVAIKSAISTGMVEDGDYIVVAAGLKSGEAGSTNLLVVHEVGVEFGVKMQ